MSAPRSTRSATIAPQKKRESSSVGWLRNLVIPSASSPDLFSSVCAECGAASAALFSLELFPGPHIFCVGPSLVREEVVTNLVMRPTGAHDE
jgi:hypothetical protein